MMSSRGTPACCAADWHGWVATFSKSLGRMYIELKNRDISWIVFACVVLVHPTNPDEVSQLSNFFQHVCVCIYTRTRIIYTRTSIRVCVPASQASSNTCACEKASVLTPAQL
jgi:hypothetical protein